MIVKTKFVDNKTRVRGVKSDMSNILTMDRSV